MNVGKREEGIDVVKILAGDWKKDSNVIFGVRELQIQKGVFSFDHFKFSDIAEFEVVTEDNKASILGKVGWGTVGAIALGPLGLLAGVLGGGNKRDRVMVITVRDGRKAMVKGNAKDAEKLMAATFGKSPK